MSNSKKNWKYAGKIALGGLFGACISLYFSSLSIHSRLQFFGPNETILSTAITLFLSIVVGIVMIRQLSQAKHFKHLSEEDETLADHYDAQANQKQFYASILNHAGLFVVLLNIIIVTIFKTSGNHWGITVIPFLVTSIFSVWYQIYLPKLDERMPKPNDEHYVDKLIEAMDEGERHITFSSLYKLFQFNLTAFMVIILFLAFYSAITGQSQTLALILLFMAFVYNVVFYYAKIYKYYKSR